MVRRFTVIVLWVASLVLTGILVSAQTRRDPAAIISGNDIGFRPEGWNGKARTGTWMVRVNGDWVEAQGAMKAVPATTR
ncbi:MAG TPA: hypothetical protein VK504_15015 [Vicinamibacterales bacterium]|jgi:hypothetical protein|nr:hypothetical protein [Vicinamibacterales bacterium]